MNVHVENTARILREEDPWVTSWLCRWGWHRWLKFREPVEEYHSYNTKKIRQERRCGHCNIQNFKTLGIK